MLDTTLAAERRGSVLEVDGHVSSVHLVPEGCDNAWQCSVDRKLMDAVVKALRATGHAALRSLDIEICGGAIVLWGRVPNYYQKQLAQEAAQKVGGVQGITNGLEVVCRR